MKKIITHNGIIIIDRVEIINRSDAKKIQRKKVHEIVQNYYPGLILSTNSKGAPFFQSSQVKVSISHSKDIIAVYLSETNEIGCDLEKDEKMLDRFQSKFINNNDESFDHPLYLLIVWCAKECFYKLKKGLIHDLAADVSVHNLTDSTIEIYYLEEKIKLNYLIENDYCLVYS